MKLKACRITATTPPELQSPPFNHSPGSSGDTSPEKIKPFLQIDQAAAFQLLKELDATEFKVFFFLTLRAYGWDDKTHRPGNGFARASGTFVAKGAKLSLATAERCIAKLKEKGLISKSTHSCKWGNTYHVKPILLRRTGDDKAFISPPENNKQSPKIEVPKNEGTKKEEPKAGKVPQIESPSSLKNMLLADSNLGTNIESRYLDLSLSETFENYFSKIRAPWRRRKRDHFGLKSKSETQTSRVKSS